MSKIALFSDTHDNLWNLEKALAQVNERGADALLHCGDLCAPFNIKIMAQHFSGPIHLIFGNNDGDARLIQVLSSSFPQVTHHGDYAEFELFGRKIAMIHYPQPALRIAQSGQLDLVCYGHDHEHHQQRLGPTLLVNPGELMGYWHEPGWGLYDAQSHSFEWVALA